jgi:hypothetical protein
MTNGDPALASWSGACAPASDQARARAVARAEAIAASAAGASAARESISRGTVGSEATGPNTSGAARNCARSARQSPPTARLTARSSRILPGLCRANGRRHGSSTCERAVSRPTASAVRSSRCLLAGADIALSKHILAGQRHLSCSRANPQVIRDESPGLETLPDCSRAAGVCVCSVSPLGHHVSHTPCAVLTSASTTPLLWR